MSLKDLFRRNKDDDEDDFDSEDFEDGGFDDDPDSIDDGGGDDDPGFDDFSPDDPDKPGDDSEATDTADASLRGDHMLAGSDDALDGESADEDGTSGMEADESGEESGEEAGEDVPGFDDDEFGDDDEDYEEELSGRPVILYSIIAFVFLIIIGGVGAGAWFFISSGEDTIAEGQMNRTAMNGATLSLSPPEPAGDIGKSQESGSEPAASLNDITAADGLPEEATVDTTTTDTTATDATASATETASIRPTDQAAANKSLDAIFNTGGLNVLANRSQNPSPAGTPAVAGLIIPASTMAGFESFLDHPSPSPLPRAPDQDFLQSRGQTLAPLPKIAVDGRLPWEFYSRPLVPDSGTRRVAIVITGMGLSTAETLAAIRKLPPEITLSYSPYAEDLEQWLLRSRRVGHEVMLGLPLESGNFPVEDPGPMALKSDLSAQENIARLEEILSVFQGYMGLEIVMGSKFTASALPVRNLLEAVNGRGLMILDGAWNNGSLIPEVAAELGMPYAVSSVRLDSVMAGAAIDAKIRELDALIQSRNQAIATTGMSPGVMDRLKSWLQTLPERGIELVPLSSLTEVSVAGAN